MIKEYFLGAIDLFYDLIQKTLIENENEKESQIRRWVFVLSAVLAIAVLFFGGSFFYLLDFSEFFNVVYMWAPLWAPVIFGSIFINRWLNYIRTEYIAKEGSILLEVRDRKSTRL